MVDYCLLKAFLHRSPIPIANILLPGPFEATATETQLNRAMLSNVDQDVAKYLKKKKDNQTEV